MILIKVRYHSETMQGKSAVLVLLTIGSIADLSWLKKRIGLDQIQLDVITVSLPLSMRGGLSLTRKTHFRIRVTLECVAKWFTCFFYGARYRRSLLRWSFVMNDFNDPVINKLLIVGVWGPQWLIAVLAVMENWRRDNHLCDVYQVYRSGSIVL